MIPPPQLVAVNAYLQLAICVNRSTALYKAGLWIVAVSRVCHTV